MAPSIIYNNAVQGEIFVPGQIFVFGGFALRATSLGHLEQIDSYAPGHQVRFGSLNYTTDIHGDLIVGISIPSSISLPASLFTRSLMHHPATNSLVTLLARLIVMCVGVKTGGSRVGGPELCV